jgi:bifunctional DNase/RNase
MVLAYGALALAIAFGCRNERPSDLEVDVRNVGFDHQVGAPVVILETREGGRILPIWIGPAEAQAIAMELQRIEAPRPLTHDLMKSILDRTGIALRRVRITDVKQETFFATLVLEQDGQEVEIDSRPSDAIALALRCACPILVSRALLDRGGRQQPGDERPGPMARVWGLGVQDVSPALAESLGLGTAAGALVSDTGQLAASVGGLQRGDVILAVDDTPVATVRALSAVADSKPAVRRLEVWRRGVRVVVDFDPRQRGTDDAGGE